MGNTSLQKKKEYFEECIAKFKELEMPDTLSYFYSQKKGIDDSARQLYRTVLHKSNKPLTSTHI